MDELEENLETTEMLYKAVNRGASKLLEAFELAMVNFPTELTQDTDVKKTPPLLVP